MPDEFPTVEPLNTPPEPFPTVTNEPAADPSSFIDNEKAAEYWAELKRTPIGQNPEREKILSDALFNYSTNEQLRQQREQELATRNKEERLGSLYTDPVAFKELSDDPAVRAREDLSLDPNREKMRLTNRSWLELKTGRPISSDVEYEIQRDKWGREYDGRPLSSDQEFFAERQKEYGQINIVNEAVRKVVGRGITQVSVDAALGNPTELTPIIEKVVSEYPDLEKSPDFKARTVGILRNVADEVSRTTEKIRPQLAQAIPIVQRLAQDSEHSPTRFLGRVAQGSDTEDIVALSKILGQVDQQTGQTILRMATNAVTADRTPDQRSKFIQANERIVRTFIGSIIGGNAQQSISLQEEQLDRAQQLLNSGNARIDASGNLAYPTGAYSTDAQGNLTPVPAAQQGYTTSIPQGRELTPDEFSKYNDRIETGKRVLLLQRQIQQQMEQNWNPSEKVYKKGFGSVTEDVLVGGAGVAGTMALQLPWMLIPGGEVEAGAGILARYGASAVTKLPAFAFSYFSNRESVYNNLRLQNPNASPAEVEQMRMEARNAGLIMGAFDVVEMGTMLNRFPKLREMVRNLTGGKLITTVGHVAGALAVEGGAENAQNYVENMAYRIHEMGKEDKISSGEKWGQASQKAWDDTARDMPQTFLAMLPFALLAGGIGHVEDMPSATREKLVAQMLSSEAMASMGIKTDGIARVNAAGNTEEKIAQYKKEIEGRDPAYMREVEAKNVAQMNQNIAAAGNIARDPEMPHWLQRTLDDGKTEWTVTSPDGKTYTTTDQVMFDQKLREQIAVAQKQKEAIIAEHAASDEGIASAAEARATSELLGEEAATIPEPAPAEAGPVPGVSREPVPVYSFNPETKKFTTENVIPTKELLSTLQEEEVAYKGVLECLLH